MHTHTETEHFTHNLCILQVIQTFFMDENLKLKAKLDAIVTLVDAKHIVMHLDEEKPDGAVNEATEQVICCCWFICCCCCRLIMQL